MGFDIASQRGGRSDPNYGKGRALIQEGAEETYDDEKLREILNETFRSAAYRPPMLPVVATKLLALANDPNAETGKVVQLLESDGMLASEVLKTACSPMYRGVGNVVSIRQAVTRLGMKTVRDIVVQASLSMKVFRNDHYAKPMDQLRRHCVATATIARRITHHTPWLDDYAFLCGILHDIGIAASLVVLSEHARVRKLQLCALWPAIHDFHEEAATILSKQWSLPPEVSVVIGNHHFPLLGGHAHPMIATLIMADEIAKEMGFPPALHDGANADVASLFTVDRNTPEAVAKAREVLSLSDHIYELAAFECEPLLEAI